MGALSGPSGQPSRLVFLGTPSVAVPPLRALHRAGYHVALVVTQPDKRRGRGSALLASPVKAAALELGLTVSHRVDDVIDIGAALGVVVAFGKLIRPHVLDVVPMVNLHFSLLPRWRGAAPVERALLAGDAETGVCVMTLEEGLDTGPVHARRVVPIGPQDTAENLRAALVTAGTELLIDQLDHGLSAPVAQVGEATYAAKIHPSELRLDWARPAADLDRLVRLGRAWTTFRGQRLRVLRARPLAPDQLDGADGRAPGPGELHGLVVGAGGTGFELLELLEVQPEGKGPMAARSWANGARAAPGERLGP